jgi:hypothetical protein
MAVIDIHTHAFPDALAPRAIEQLEAAASWQAVGDGTIAGLVRSMDRDGIDVSVMCAVATRPSQAQAILEWCGRIASDRIVAFPSIHPKTPDAARWLGRIADEGFAGIKLHPMYQDFDADDEAMDGIYDAAARLGLVVAIHCGKDIAYPPDDDRAGPRRMRKVIDRHPSLKLLCTHMGGWRDWDEAARELVGVGVYLETSFSLGELGRERSAGMIRAHGPPRVLMGSDWPWQRQREQVELVRGLGLGTRDTDAILFSNAAKLLGL